MPTREHWQEVQRLVDGALDLPPEARGTFLDRACGSTERCGVKQRVSSMRASMRPSRADSSIHRPQVRLPDCYRRCQTGTPWAASSDAAAWRRSISRATCAMSADVAVKVLEPTVASMGAERFLREIRVAARLTHPHVLSVYDSGEIGRSSLLRHAVRRRRDAPCSPGAQWCPSDLGSGAPAP